MTNVNDTFGNQTRDLPACSAVPQQAESLRTLTVNVVYLILIPTHIFIAFVLHSS
jgi:hypothetical protein